MYINIKEMTGISAISEATQERINKCLDIHRMFVDEEVTHLFITNTVNAETQQENYVNLWIITDTLISEIKNFMFSTNIDFLRKNKWKYSTMEFNDFNFTESVPTSRFYINVIVTETTSMSFIAHGENCKNLFKLYNEVLKPFI